MFPGLVAIGIKAWMFESFLHKNLLTLFVLFDPYASCTNTFIGSLEKMYYTFTKSVLRSMTSSIISCSLHLRIDFGSETNIGVVTHL